MNEIKDKYKRAMREVKPDHDFVESLKELQITEEKTETIKFKPAYSRWAKRLTALAAVFIFILSGSLIYYGISRSFFATKSAEQNSFADPQDMDSGKRGSSEDRDAAAIEQAPKVESEDSACLEDMHRNGAKAADAYKDSDIKSDIGTEEVLAKQIQELIDTALTEEIRSKLENCTEIEVKQTDNISPELRDNLITELIAAYAIKPAGKESAIIELISSAPITNISQLQAYKIIFDDIIVTVEIDPETGIDS